MTATDRQSKLVALGFAPVVAARIAERLSKHQLQIIWRQIFRFKMSPGAALEIAMSHGGWR